MKEELRHIKHAITLLQKAVAQLEGQLSVETEKKQNGFKPPHPDEANRFYVAQNYSFDLNEWRNHYISNGWKVGRNTMKDWHACMAQWQARHKKKNPDRTIKSYDASGREIKGNGTGRLL